MADKSLIVLAECVDSRTGTRFQIGDTFDPPPTEDQATRLVAAGCLPKTAIATAQKADADAQAAADAKAASDAQAADAQAADAVTAAEAAAAAAATDDDKAAAAKALTAAQATKTKADATVAKLAK